MLSCSRKGYTETVWRQTTEESIHALENAFWHFGGVPRTVVIDNLKAAATRADWSDPDIHPKIEAFARHYGTVSNLFFKVDYPAVSEMCDTAVLLIPAYSKEHLISPSGVSSDG